MATGNGRLENIQLNSNPPGANVTVDGRPMGQTPTSVDLLRTEDHTVKFDLPGCPTHVVVLKHGPNQEVLKNFLFPGPPGFLVDAYSGAAEGALTPSVVNVTIEPAHEAAYVDTPPAPSPASP